MTSWLSRQRKGELQELASTAGIKGAANLLKEDLVSSIESVLRENPSKYSTIPSFKEFYERQRGSPVKKERQSTAPLGSPDAEKPKRKKTIKKEDVENVVQSTVETVQETAQELVTRAPEAVREMAQDAQELATRTPATVRNLASRIPLPPSPAVVTDAISHQQEVIQGKFEELWNGSGISETSDYIRELLSSVSSVQIIFTLLEAYGLQKDVLPWDIELTIPKIPALGADERTLYLPDLFSLLGGHFWTTSLVWLTTSVGIPLLFAYFFNFTYAARPAHATRSASRRNPHHSVDPLTYNVVKGLVAWLVYAQGFRFWGAIGDSTVSSINDNLWGGYILSLVGASTGALFSLHDAILRKQ